MSSEETITKAQLTEALEELGYISGNLRSGSAALFKVVNPSGIADVIFRKFREPEYEVGVVYKDAMGEFYMLDTNCVTGEPAGGWLAVGTGYVYQFETPRRPLRKMVEE